MQATNPWAAIVGWRSQGRIDTVRTVVESLRAAGHTVGGFRQDRFGQGERIDGYDLVGFETGERHAMARQGADPQLCDWVFDAEVFDTVRRRMLTSAAQVTVLELGPLEARGKGHWPAVEELLRASARLVVLCIRPTVLARIAIEMPDPIAGLELPATPTDVEIFARDLVDAVPRIARQVPGQVDDRRVTAG